MSLNNGNLLAIDYGTKFLGLAFSAGQLAEPLTTLKFTSEAQAVTAIMKIIREKKINKVVIGIPEGRIKKKSQAFGRKIKRVAKLAVVYFDETLSSYEAKKKMREAKKSWLKRKQKEHEIAACLILEQYLD